MVVSAGLLIGLVLATPSHAYLNNELMIIDPSDPPTGVGIEGGGGSGDNSNYGFLSCFRGDGTGEEFFGRDNICHDETGLGQNIKPNKYILRWCADQNEGCGDYPGPTYGPIELATATGYWCVDTFQGALTDTCKAEWGLTHHVDIGAVFTFDQPVTGWFSGVAQRQ